MRCDRAEPLVVVVVVRGVGSHRGTEEPSLSLSEVTPRPPVTSHVRR